MIHINLNMIFYTHVKHRPTKTVYINYYLKNKIKIIIQTQNQGGSDNGREEKKKKKGEKAAAFVNDVYERFQWKEQTGCGNRVRGCLRQSPVQAADGPAHPIWSRSNSDPVCIAGALLERTVVMQLGNWSSALHQFTPG